jgi:hypothetical protein
MNINLKQFLIFFFFGAVLSASPLFSQQLDGGAFGAPVVKFSSIAGQNAILAGGGFGWVIDSSIVLGGGIYALESRVKTNIVDPISGQDVLLGFNCGGIELEYIFFPRNYIHASIDMFIAGAGTTYGVSNKSVPHSSYFSQNLLLVEPQVNIEFNIVDWLHIDTGVSYRICIPPGTDSFYDTGGIGLHDLQGLSVLFTFKFGEF